MAKGLTMWKSDDGKIFETEREAKAHEFATMMLRRVGRREGNGDPYQVLKFLHEQGHIVDASPQQVD